MRKAASAPMAPNTDQPGLACDCAATRRIDPTASVWPTRPMKISDSTSGRPSRNTQAI